jgi:hypothetical protein
MRRRESEEGGFDVNRGTISLIIGVLVIIILVIIILQFL